MTDIKELTEDALRKRIDVLRTFKLNVLSFYMYNFDPEPTAKFNFRKTLVASAIKKQIYLALKYMQEAGYKGGFSFDPDPKICGRREYSKVLNGIDSSIGSYESLLHERLLAQAKELIEPKPQDHPAESPSEPPGDTEGIDQQSQEDAQARFYELSAQKLKHEIDIQNSPIWKRNKDAICAGMIILFITTLVNFFIPNYQARRLSEQLATKSSSSTKIDPHLQPKISVVIDKVVVPHISFDNTPMPVSAGQSKKTPPLSNKTKTKQKE